MDLARCIQHALARPDELGQRLLVSNLDVHAAFDTMVPERVGTEVRPGGGGQRRRRSRRTAARRWAFAFSREWKALLGHRGRSTA